MNLRKGAFAGSRLPRGLAAISLLAALALAGEAGAERLKVCAFGFHGPEEIAVFKARLPAEDFDVIDLSPRPLYGPSAGAGAPLAAGATAEVGTTGWLPKLCRRDLQCDVVVYSAEFAGRFFGRSGQSLSVQEMEEASCRAECAGLFHSPREVFLLACNTLATKDPDMRDPETYLRVLLDHDFDRATAERVVAMRYGPLGPTFREALRRVFLGVPRIYGFSSVAPVGEYTAPMLESYFRSVGDYRRHLEQIRADGPPNRALRAAFARTELVQTSGLDPDEPGAQDRNLICTLYDESQPVTLRLRIIQQLMDRPDLLAFVPTVQVFIARHPPRRMKGEEKRLFDEIRRNDAARAQVLSLVQDLDVSALKLEVADFAANLGWLGPAEFDRLATDAARELLRRPLTSEVVDVMCELPKHGSVGRHFGSPDLSDALFLDPEGIRLISCLAPSGDRVSARLAAVLDHEDTPTRAWAAHAISRRLPLPEPVLLAVADHLDDPSIEVSERLRWIFKAQRPVPREVRRAVERNDPELARQLWP